MEICNCDKPEVFENVRGAKGNVCKVCEGKVEDTPNLDVRLYNELQAGIAEISGTSEDREKLIAVLINKARPWVKEVAKITAFNEAASKRA